MLRRNMRGPCGRFRTVLIATERPFWRNNRGDLRRIHALLVFLRQRPSALEVAFVGPDEAIIYVGGVGVFELDLETGVTIPIS